MFSETSVTTYVSTRRHDSGKQHRVLRRRQNLLFLLCVEQQEIVLMNLLYETSFMQLLPLCIACSKFYHDCYIEQSSLEGNSRQLVKTLLPRM
jgi:hypothetical protein